MKKIINLFIIFSFVFIISCKDKTTVKSETETSQNIKSQNNKLIYLKIKVNDSKLRRGPGVDYEIIKLLHKNTKLILVEKKYIGVQIWYYVKVPDLNLEGWIYSILTEGYK